MDNLTKLALAILRTTTDTEAIIRKTNDPTLEVAIVYMEKDHTGACYHIKLRYLDDPNNGVLEVYQIPYLTAIIEQGCTYWTENTIFVAGVKQYG